MNALQNDDPREVFLPVADHGEIVATYYCHMDHAIFTAVWIDAGLEFHDLGDETGTYDAHKDTDEGLRQYARECVYFLAHDPNFAADSDDDDARELGDDAREIVGHWQGVVA